MVADIGVHRVPGVDDIHVWHESTVRPVHTVAVFGRNNGPNCWHRHGTIGIQLSKDLDIFG